MNRLALTNSPYLLQHQHNPVNWYPWGEEALNQARLEDKPIFLSIGYAACHWCHVMERESFENQSIADFMNTHFVNIKVDREERPDLDDIYMNAVAAMTGHGGWPLSVFLTPQGEPFYGGTYFPPSPRYGVPSFLNVLENVASAWRENQTRLKQAAAEITVHVNQVKGLQGTPQKNITAQNLDEAAFKLIQTYDWDKGGWGKAPKFPQPMAIQFLLLRASQGDKLALEVAVHALTRMAKGGMYDLVGGGFARYSTDNDWLVPHFEKMLYDNAQLAILYLQANLLTGDAWMRQVCESTLDFIARELMIEVNDQKYCFLSSVDADSEGEEGKYYIWSIADVQKALVDLTDQKLALSAYGISEQGNFEGKNILTRSLSDRELAGKFSLPLNVIQEKLQSINGQLLAYRERRIHPATDDKGLTSWNSLALMAFSEAGRYLNRTEYLQIAQNNARFLLEELHHPGKLYRSWRQGKADHNGNLEDYSALALALLDLYQSDHNTRWYDAANRILNEMQTYFQDHDFGYFDTREDQRDLIVRPKNLQDNATPSGNSLAARALLLQYAFAGDSYWYEKAEKAILHVTSAASAYPTSFGSWLIGAFHLLNPYREVAILGDPTDEQTKRLIDVVLESFLPDVVLAVTDLPIPVSAPPLLLDRPLVNNQPTAYLCQNFICQKPVNRQEELRDQLHNAL